MNINQNDAYALVSREAEEQALEIADLKGRIKWKKKMDESEWVDYSEHAKENPNWYIPLYEGDELVAYEELVEEFEE